MGEDIHADFGEVEVDSCTNEENLPHRLRYEVIDMLKGHLIPYSGYKKDINKAS